LTGIKYIIAIIYRTIFILAINQHAPETGIDYIYIIYETGESTGFKRINSRSRKIGLKYSCYKSTPQSTCT